MLNWLHPEWLGLLPVWLGLALYSWRKQRGEEAGSRRMTLVHPNLDLLPDSAAAPALPRAGKWLNLLALVCLTLALAQPQWIGEWLPAAPQGREIVLLVDTSRTMSINDFELDGQPVERLAVVKSLMARFVAGRAGDRFGLVAFGSVAGTLVPPTFDRDLVTAMLQRIQVGIAGDDTAIGDAIGLALKQLRGQPRLRPALILFSDGDNTAGDITPGEAVELARQMAVPVYTVQVGGDLFAAGRPPASAGSPPAEPGLEQIAVQTGGRHYQAGNRNALQAVIRDIGQRETTLTRPATQRAVQEWYLLPLLLAVLLLSWRRVLQIRRGAA